jgi:hypothetical protein
VGWRWSASITGIETLLRGPSLGDERRDGCECGREGGDGKLVKPKRGQELRYRTNRFGKYVSLQGLTMEFTIATNFCHMWDYLLYSMALKKASVSFSGARKADRD